MDEDAAALAIGAARDLADLVERRRTLFTSKGEFVIRQYGAASLVRGCGLMRGAIACNTSGENEAVGVLVRAIMESWISGAFIMFGGAESLARMDAERQRNERILVERNGVDAAQLIADRKAELDDVARTYSFRLGEDGEPRFGRLTVETMAEELGPLVERATGESADIVGIYNLLYRSYSTFDAHGLEPLERHLDLVDLSLTSMRTPSPWVDPGGSIAVACLLLALMAKWVFESFRIGVHDVERIFAAIAPIVEEAGVAAFAQAPREVIDALPSHFRPSQVTPR